MPRGSKTNEKIKAKRRDSILSSALFLFATHGMVATRISDIAKHSEMSQGLIYHYFSCKEDIFVELISKAFEKLITACQTLENMDCPAKEKVTLVVQGLTQSLKENKDSACYHLLLTQATASETIPQAARDIINSHHKIPYEVIARIMKGGQFEGTIIKQDPKKQALLFWSTINGLAILRFNHGSGVKLPDNNMISGIFLKER